MPDILDLYIPNKEGKKSLYRLELLGGGIGFTTLSLYHRRVEERKTKSGKARQVKTYGFCFECETGKLAYASIHTGDFTNPSFRWLDTREEQFDAEKIPGTCYIQAIRYIEKAHAFLNGEKEKAPTYKERDRCERFLSPLEKILGLGK